MKIGIEKIGIYSPSLYVDMTELAEARGDDPAKYTIGIGQNQMAVAPLSQDIVTMAANAAFQVLDDEDREKIDLVIVGTESAFDASKSAATYVHQLLGIQPQARSIEMKQACYGATAGIQLAKGHIALNPDRKALVIGSDVARYGLATGGEVTQGAGAIAMVISANPKVLELENHSAYLSRDIMDFWRPTYSPYAKVDGKYSNEQYLTFFKDTWELFKEKSGLGIADMAALSFHLPYTKMGKKALTQVLDEADKAQQEQLKQYHEAGIAYNRNVGNIYTGSLYLSLLSLLVHAEGLQAGERIGLFSYGSGAVAEFFSGILANGFRESLAIDAYEKMFQERRRVTVAEYEEIFSQELPEDGSEFVVQTNDDAATFTLAKVHEHKRYYNTK